MPELRGVAWLSGLRPVPRDTRVGRERADAMGLRRLAPIKRRSRKSRILGPACALCHHGRFTSCM
jgi:hypothetical protein